jgi:hypothetical protein
MSVVMDNDNNETKRARLGPEIMSNNHETNKIIHLGPEAMNNEKLDYRKEFRPVRLPPPGPKFLYFDPGTNRVIYPETYHTFNPTCIFSNTIRKYEEHNL